MATSRIYNMFTDNLRQQIQNHTAASNPAWNSFLQKKLPTKKMEDWKYTDVSFLNQLDFQSDVSHASTGVMLVEHDTLVISPALMSSSLPSLPGCRLLRGAEALSYLAQYPKVGTSSLVSNYFSDLCEVSKPESLVLVVDKSWDSQKVLKLNFEAIDKAAVFSNLSVSVIIQSNVSLQLQETFIVPESAALNMQLSYFVAENSSLTSLKIDKTKHSRILTTQSTIVEKNATYKMVHFTSQTQWARHNVYVGLAGEAAHADLAASYLVGEGQFVDHHTFVDHQVGLTTSQQVYSGVISQKATGVYNGKVWIQRDAQKSNAEQLSRNLLLSKTAEANSKPELLIDADDVKAKHGATIGQMDQEELFYMQSRGLTLQQAREMVLKSFAFGVADHLPDALQKAFVDRATQGINEFVDGMRHV